MRLKDGGVLTDTEGKDHFVHYSNIIMKNHRRLYKGDIVKFEIGFDKNGRERAINVNPIMIRKMVSKELSKKRLHIKNIKNQFELSYMIMDQNDNIIAGEHGMSLIEVAAYAGICMEETMDNSDNPVINECAGQVAEAVQTMALASMVTDAIQKVMDK